ncbi:Multicopper oxidase [Cellulosimicrobium aquatile]|uniref:Multicopper oxidase n=2 Tax=Cellulosimicrobium TaxID=157920 RepID=A0A1N6Q5W0_9MICO|nr:multicopper oxidase domain-containing protein [Cellulosimicrobium aquatile]UTT58974.1 multicopper oxidase domain-containing protein [Cellulosimicrobium cellulans]SIQ11895.1 Multicopper oxidase [Cellulosimicrobium aquatile]
MPDPTTETAPRPLSRRALLAGAGVVAASPAAALLLGAGGSVAAAPPAAAATTVTAATGVRKITMYAERISDTLVGYGLERGKATVPGPILEMWEGETLEITLVNTTDKRLSIHPHGVNYDVNSDGSTFNNSFNEPGETRTYTWSTVKMARDRGIWMPGSAGYWHYHDHAWGEHGTQGLAAGLYGALVVRRVGDVLPQKQFTMVFNDMTINNKVAPDTPMFEAKLGERVEFICIGHGNQLHTFHLHAHRWANNRTGLLADQYDPSQVVDNRDLNPGDAFGFQVVAGLGVGPGAWMYHCHVQFHSDGGMAGIFLVRNADGSMPPGAQESIDRFQGHGSHTMSAPSGAAPSGAAATTSAPATAPGGPAAGGSGPAVVDLSGHAGH